MLMKVSLQNIHAVTASLPALFAFFWLRLQDLSVTKCGTVTCIVAFV